MVEPVTHRLLGTLRDEGVGTRELVSGAALVLVLAQLAWRAWIVVPGWFYADDLLLLEDAARPLQSVLLEPNDSQLMPLGRVVAALVAAAGPYAWWAAATSVLVLSAAATAACWLMLRTVFGPRPFVLVPFGLFLERFGPEVFEPSDPGSLRAMIEETRQTVMIDSLISPLVANWSNDRRLLDMYQSLLERS